MSDIRDILKSRLSKENVRWFADNKGGREIHRLWRDNMLRMGRQVSDKRKEWETLDSIDRELDRQISYGAIIDFIVWLSQDEED